MEHHDISIPIRPGMPVYEGDPDVHLERVASIERGDAVNMSRLDFVVHSGTHVDAPLHFIGDGEATESLPLEWLIGPTNVVDATSLDKDIDREEIERLDVPRGLQRLLFKTRNSELWNLDGFSRDFIRLTESGARCLIERGVRLVGIDYLSIGTPAAHRALLGAGVVAVEGLDLRGVEPGTYRLICLPLRLVGSDGAPARAILTRTTEQGDG